MLTVIGYDAGVVSEERMRRYENTEGKLTGVVELLKGHVLSPQVQYFHPSGVTRC
jgi:hypothetical protein